MNQFYNQYPHHISPNRYTLNNSPIHSPQKSINYTPTKTLSTGSILISQRTSYQIDNEKELGIGTFGAVRLAIDRQSDKKFAIKIISKDKVKKLNAYKNISQEVILHSKLSHRNILKYVENFEDSNNIYIVVEYCSKGNLYELIKKKSKLTERQVFPIFYQLTQGLNYLANQNIAHRDIKPANILFYEDNSLRICDYNWAQKIPTGGKCEGVICGTTEYMPPEVVTRQQHDHRVDTWSLGIVLYEMLHGQMPFRGSNQKEKIQAIVCQSNFKIDADLSLDLQMLLHSLLSRIVDSRPSYPQILQSKWFMRMFEEIRNPELTRAAATQYRKVPAIVQSERLSFLSLQNTTCTTQNTQNTQKTRSARYNSSNNNSEVIIKIKEKSIMAPPDKNNLNNRDTVLVKSVSGAHQGSAFVSSSESLNKTINSLNIPFTPHRLSILTNRFSAYECRPPLVRIPKYTQKKNINDVI